MTIRSAALAVMLVAPTAAASPQAGPGDDAQRAVVERACTSCHKLPPPDILPKSSWKSLVYQMAGMILQGIGAPAGKSPWADFDLDQVAHYYESRAPETLPSPAPWPAPGHDPDRFVRHVLRYPGATAPAAIANVRLLKLSRDGPTEVVADDMLAGLVLAGDPRRPEQPMRVLAHVPNPCHSEAVDLDRDGLVDLVVSNLGGPKPGDFLRGTVTWLRQSPKGVFQPIVLASKLPRIADVEPADLDGDGDVDLVVAAFGWRQVGSIFWLENRTTDWTKPVFVPHELDPRTGTIHVPITDLDHDGHLDFVGLISQQYETVVAFLGDGKGGFRERVIDEAPHPAWGSSGLQLVDLDGDGDTDVLVTNGDMLDDLQLKPYHGIRWLENRGSYPFFPHALANMFGVMRAQAADLDGDGDMDVVACSMVQGDPKAPLARQGIPSLVWLEQTSPGHFERHTLELGSRHLSLDLGDYDGDGDVDIVTANSLSGAPGEVEVWENKGRRP
jgi:FG-GAP-like repeat